jgi:hypothetical protein
VDRTTGISEDEMWAQAKIHYSEWVALLKRKGV